MANANAPTSVTASLENEAGFDADGEPFIVSTPDSPCCNCGTQAGLAPVPTHYVKAAKFSTNLDDRPWFDLELPYCQRCAARVGKYSAATVLRILVGFVLWGGSLMGLAVMLPTGAPAWLRWFVFVPPVVLVWLAFRLWDRPSAPMTAKWFPVRIREYSGHPRQVRYAGISAFVLSGIAAVVGSVTHKLSGKNPNAIYKLTFQFSNPKYAAAFAKVNGRRLRDGSLVIKNLPAAAELARQAERAAEKVGQAKPQQKPVAAAGHDVAKPAKPAKAVAKAPAGPVNFGEFSEWFVAYAQAYCDWHDGEESGDDVTLSTQIRRAGLRPAKPGDGKPAGSFELALAMEITTQYHAAPVTPNLNDKGLEALAIINAMRGQSGGTQKLNWWLWFAPDTQHGTAGWRHVNGEVQEQGADGREPVADTEWIDNVMSQVDMPVGPGRAWQTEMVNGTPIVSAGRPS